MSGLAAPAPGTFLYSSAAHHGQWLQNSRSTPQPHLPHVSELPGIFHADPGMPFPASFPNRAELHWLAWYPPQESDEDVAPVVDPLVAAERIARVDLEALDALRRRGPG